VSDYFSAAPAEGMAACCRLNGNSAFRPHQGSF